MRELPPPTDLRAICIYRENIRDSDRLSRPHTDVVDKPAPCSLLRAAAEAHDLFQVTTVFQVAPFAHPSGDRFNLIAHASLNERTYPLQTIP